MGIVCLLQDFVYLAGHLFWLLKLCVYSIDQAGSNAMIIIICLYICSDTDDLFRFLVYKWYTSGNKPVYILLRSTVKLMLSRPVN